MTSYPPPCNTYSNGIHAWVPVGYDHDLTGDIDINGAPIKGRAYIVKVCKNCERVVHMHYDKFGQPDYRA